MDAKQLAEQLAHEAELAFGELIARLALRNTTDSRAAATRLQQQDETIRLLHDEVERLRDERSQLLDALRELYDFAGPYLSAKYRDRSTIAFERALEVLQRLEAREE